MAKMSSKIFVIALLLVGVFFSLTQDIDTARDHLAFENETEQVAKSLKRLENLMNKFPRPEQEIVNYFTDYSGNLYLNSKKIAPLNGAINNPEVRDSEIFINFSEHEIDEFFYLIAYLWKNYITTCSREPSIDHFVFSYRVKKHETSTNGRFVMVIHQESDTTSAKFRRIFRVINSNSGLALIRTK